MVRIFTEYKINKTKISVFFCITEKNIDYLNQYATLRPSNNNHRNMYSNYKSSWENALLGS